MGTAGQRSGRRAPSVSASEVAFRTGGHGDGDGPSATGGNSGRGWQRRAFRRAPDICSTNASTKFWKQPASMASFESLRAQFLCADGRTELGAGPVLSAAAGRVRCVYDMSRNEACVSVGRDQDTLAFAVALIRTVAQMGHSTYRHATALLVAADAGGSNGYRVRAWSKSSNS